MLFWSQDWFNDLFYFAQNLGIKNSTCLDAITEEMQSDSGEVKKLVLDFIKETKGELFSSPEECIEHCSKDSRFEKLANGELGDNVMNKFRAVASFLVWPEVCEMVTKVIKRLILTQGSDELDPEFELFWKDLCLFVKSKHADGRSVDDVLLPLKCQLNYDFSRWIDDGYPRNVSSYKNKDGCS